MYDEEANKLSSVKTIETCGYFITSLQRRPLDSYEWLEVTRRKFQKVTPLPDFCEIATHEKVLRRKADSAAMRAMININAGVKK